MKIAIPKYDSKRGWTGGDSRVVYAFTDRRTGVTKVAPVQHAESIGPEVEVRPATRMEAWDNDYKSSGWKNLDSEFPDPMKKQSDDDPHGENLTKLVAAKKGKREPKQQSVETGARGGRFYITPSGAKIYVKNK